MNAIEVQSPGYDITDGLFAWANGELNCEGTIELFQALVDSGLAWQFQGHNHPVTATTTSTGESKVVPNATDRVHFCPIKALPFDSSVSSYLLVVPGENDVRMCRSRQPFGSCKGTWNCG